MNIPTGSMCPRLPAARLMRMLVASASAWALVVAVAGCSANDAGDTRDADTPVAPDAAATTAETSAESTDVPSPSPSSDEAQAASTAATTVRPRVESTRIVGGPDWLAADTTAIYVKRESGGVDQVDPHTGDVVATVDVGGRLCEGIGAGFDSVWACRGTDVIRIDFDTEEITATIPVGKAFEQGTLPAAHDRVWVLVGDGSSLVGIDPAFDQPSPPVELGLRGTDVFADDQGLWVVSRVDDGVVRIDPATGSQLWRTDVPGAIAVASNGDGDVWVGGHSQTVRLDGSTGAIEDTVDLGPTVYGALAMDGNDLWVRSPEGFLQRVDTTTGEVVETVDAEATSGGDLIVAFDALWATAIDDAALFRVQLGS